MWTKEEMENFKQKMKQEKAQKKDYVVSCDNIQTQYDAGRKALRLRVGSDASPLWFDINSWMGQQIAEKCHINKPFYDYLLDTQHGSLLATNINELIRDKEKRMVRTIGNTARALVSDSYRPIDNLDMFEFFTDAITVLNTEQHMDIQVERCEITDRRFYMRAISNRLTDEIFGEIDRDLQGKPIRDGLKKGDVVHGGIQISNSEVGAGAYCVEPFMFVVRCSNGLISDQAVRRRHLGRKLDEQVIDWSQRTKELEDETLWSQLTDMVFSTFSPDIFKKWVDNINKVASEEITTPIIAVNHVVSSYKQFLTKENHEELLTRFAKYGFTRWGLSQSVTDLAQTKPFDTRIELEKVGNDILLNTPLEVLSKKEN